MLAISVDFSDWLLNNYFLWLLGTCLAVALAVALAESRRVRDGQFPSQVEPAVAAALRPARSTAYFALGVMVGLYGWLMLAWEDFAFFDGHYFYPLLAGQPEVVPLQMFPNLGRYFPLGHQEFHAISLLGKSAQTYQCFAFAELLLGGFLITRILRRHAGITTAVCIAMLTTPPIVTSMFHIIVPERNMLFLLCVFVWAVFLYVESGSRTALVAANLAAFVFLQYKETAVILLAVWAGYLLVAARGRIALTPTERRGRLRMLAATIIAGCFIWLAVYAVAILPQIAQSYLVGRQQDRLDVLQSVASEIWLWVLLGAVLLRLLLARIGTQVSPLWDGMPLAALSSTASYMYLGFTHDYYYAPAALLAWLYAGHMAELVFFAIPAERQKLILVVILAVVAELTVLQLPQAFYGSVAQWKENTASKADAAEFIDALDVTRRSDQPNASLRLLFPHNSNYEVGFFVGYLQAKYDIKGLEVGMAQDALGDRTELCVRWIPIDCHYGLPPRAGDLIVFFGERGPKMDDLAQRYRLLHVSPDIGFWHNILHVYVFVAG